jgi:tRNA modification GTPase
MTVSVLTPPGTGAIATVRVAGAGAWAAVRERFRPAGTDPLPESPEPHRVWFGTLGDGGDEVVIGVEQGEPEPVIAIHCHGGRRVVRWVCELLEQDLPPRPPLHEWRGGVQDTSAEVGPSRRDGLAKNVRFGEPDLLLARAPTLRTASILLDQHHGAFSRAVAACLEDLTQLPRFAALAAVGRHLVEPWQVVLAGPPNVGKSSLINALAGFERSVVAPVAGTTRDVVTVRVAFDGWPVELSDTAGLRESGEELEAEGIARTKARLRHADLVVWVMDLTDPLPPPDGFTGVVVGNKADLATTSTAALPVSAVTRAGIPLLIGEIVRRLVPVPPRPGEGVPDTPALAELVESAAATVAAGNPDAARKLLRDHIG